MCLSDQTKAVTAEYAMGGDQPTRLLLIEYPGESEARTAFESFGTSYFQGISISADQRINIARMGEEEYNAMSLKDNFVILVFEASYSDLCIELVAATLTKIEILS